MIAMIHKNITQVLLAVCMVCSAAVLLAQPMTEASYEDQVEAADSSLYSGDFINAYEWYDKAYKQSKDRDLAALKAQSQFGYRDYVRAERSYSRIFRRDKDGIYDYLRLEYAIILIHNEKYAEAAKELNTVIDKSTDEEDVAEAKILLEGINSMDKYPDNLEASISFIEGDINSPFEEYSPVLHPDGTLYFASFNRKSMITLDGKEEGYECKIFSSKRNKDGEYEKPKPLSEQINRKDFHAANVSFSEDGETMYFTRSQFEDAQPKNTKIWRAKKTSRGWSQAAELPTVNGNWFATQPCEGELFGKKVLYFVADIPGGYGGLDIYYSTIKGDEFSTPVNLGERVNTPLTEKTPFYTDGTLYFSSDGYPGLGGLDIFYSTWDGTVWSDPSNMGFGYNSSVDDMYYRSSPDGSKAYLVSNRANKKKRKLKSETCCTDIYAVTLREIVVDLQALVDDPNGPLLGATIELRDNSMDGEQSSKTNMSTNDFSFILEPEHDYTAVVTKEGYYPDSISFNTVGVIDDYTIRKTIKLNPKPVVPDDSGDETETITVNQAIRLNNIYYDFDKWDILPDAEESLDYLIEIMEDYPDIVVELSSHTDSQGRDGYNKTLSQKRAESAKYFMVSNGIDPNRIVPVGYGEEQIINQCVNGVKCSDDEHRRNRRTEFKIIEGPDTITIKKQVPASR